MGPRILAVLILAVTAVPASGQDLWISKKVKSFNFDPRAAVNSRGDVLITWTELDLSDSTYSQIWAVLLKKSKNGFKRRKPRRVSDLGTYNTGARPTWSERDKSFLLVWDTRRTAGTPSSILGRAARKNGKPTGKVFEIVADGEENFGASIVAQADSSRPLALYYSRATNPAKATGSEEFFVDFVENLFLNGFGQPPDIPAQFGGAGKQVAGIKAVYPINEVGADTDCKVVITQEGTPPNSTVRVLLVIDGVAVGGQRRLTGGSLVAAHVGDGSTGPVSGWIRGNHHRTGKAFQIRFNARCAPPSLEDSASSSFALFENDDPDWPPIWGMSSSVPASLQGASRGFVKDQWIYAANDGALKSAAINVDKFETPRTLTSTDNKATFVRALTLTPPGAATRAATPEVLVLWLKAVADKQEVRAHLFTPE